MQPIALIHFSLHKLGIERFSLSKLEVVAVFDSFIFKKRKKQVVRKTYKNLKLEGILEMKVTIETPVLNDKDVGLVATSCVVVVCTQTTEFNIKNMLKDIENNK